MPDTLATPTETPTGTSSPSSSLKLKWSEARRNQLATGRFDWLNRMVAIADGLGPSNENEPASVPIIDISAFCVYTSNGNGEDDLMERQAKCVNEVLSACQDTGFFKITGHGVPKEVTDKMNKETHTFFEQPRSVKEQASDPANASHGYYAKENINATLGRKGSADIREGYAIGPPEDENCPFFQNIWPPQDVCGDGFETASKEYYRCMEQLERSLSVIFTRAIKLCCAPVADHLTDDWLQASTGRHRGLLRPNYYPARSGTFGAHTDWSTFTILRPSGPGLEVVQDGEWRQVTFEDGDDSFVVNVGDMVERWTNGAFCSSIHRVNRALASSHDHNDTMNRISFAYFAAEVVDPTDDSTTLPILKPGEERMFEEDLSMLEYMKRNFEGMTGKEYGEK